MLEWWRGFVRDTGVIGADDTIGVDSRLDHGGLFVWEDPDPVSMVGVTRAIAGVVRVGPVYTPPALRRNGYAGSAVAATSRDALAAGADTCMLFTDLANPTSNKIYAEIGYRRFADWEEHEFSNV
jgi:predicted GNAT family acetyltransferase